jgi:5-methylcytosine-specific restriction endonuclease McrA
MASNDRFYQLKMRHREVLKGDIGSLIKIEGLVVGGGGARAVLLLPGCEVPKLLTQCCELSVEEWSEYLQRSDDPEILVMPAKAFHRKLRYEISGAVQQKVWAADGFKCMYCGAAMGNVQLTIDHFRPLEQGGTNDESNYISACRRCNKDKGGEHPTDFCLRRGLSYTTLADYLANRKLN